MRRSYPGQDFCQKYPLNARCRKYIPIKERNSSQNNSDFSRNEIVETLTIEKVEQYLKKIGYIDLSILDNKSIILVMQGQPSIVYLDRTGIAISLSSYFPKDENITLETINNWNKSLRFSMAYIREIKDKDSIILETTLTVTGGVTEQKIESFFKQHAAYINYFAKYLNDQ